jgi:hypothetical protein
MKITQDVRGTPPCRGRDSTCAIEAACSRNPPSSADVEAEVEETVAAD